MWVEYIFCQCRSATDCLLVYVQVAWKKRVGSNKMEANDMLELVPARGAMYELLPQRSVGNGVPYLLLTLFLWRLTD